MEWAKRLRTREVLVPRRALVAHNAGYGVGWGCGVQVAGAGAELPPPGAVTVTPSAAPGVMDPGSFVADAGGVRAEEGRAAGTSYTAGEKKVTTAEVEGRGQKRKMKAMLCKQHVDEAGSRKVRALPPTPAQFL